MSLVVLGDLTLGIFFKMAIIRGISGSTPRLSAGWASMCGMCTLRTLARTYIHAGTKTNYCQIYLM